MTLLLLNNRDLDNMALSKWIYSYREELALRGAKDSPYVIK